MTNAIPSSLLKATGAVLLGGLILVACGCQQRRYEPAQWRPALAGSTLPKPQVASASSLPGRAGGTLPGRGMTLPNRGSTFPGRSTTLPGRSTTLPGRGWSQPERGPIWDTSPKRQFDRPSAQRVPQWPSPLSGSTLPGRRGATTLPGRIGGTTLPLRLPDHLQPPRPGTTLPGRWPARRGMTLPRR